MYHLSIDACKYTTSNCSSASCTDDPNHVPIMHEFFPCRIIIEISDNINEIASTVGGIIVSLLLDSRMLHIKLILISPYYHPERKKESPWFLYNI